jgi:hypothetical protein
MKCGVKCGLDSARSEWGPVVGLLLVPEKARNLLTVWNETARQRHEDRLHPCYWDNNASKAVPIPPCSGQGGEELRLLLILDLCTRWVEWSASCPGRALPSGKHAVPIVQEAGWASEMVSTQRLEEKSFASAGNRTPFAQSVVSDYTDWATPAPIQRQQFYKRRRLDLELACKKQAYINLDKEELW